MKNHLLDIMIFKEPIGSMNTRGFNNFSALAVVNAEKRWFEFIAGLLSEH